MVDAEVLNTDVSVEVRSDVVSKGPLSHLSGTSGALENLHGTTVFLFHHSVTKGVFLVDITGEEVVMSFLGSENVSLVQVVERIFFRFLNTYHLCAESRNGAVPEVYGIFCQYSDLGLVGTVLVGVINLRSVLEQVGILGVSKVKAGSTLSSRPLSVWHLGNFFSSGQLLEDFNLK